MAGEAFGAPGIPPTWTSSAKDLVSTSLGPSRVWATVGFGILNEVYWPATGIPQVRDLGFIVAGADTWHEVKREHRYRLSTPGPAIPLARAVHEGPGYRLTLEFLPDPLRDVVLIAHRLEGEGTLYALLAPHLGGSGLGNTAWVDGKALLACSGAQALCLLGSDRGFSRGSAGFVGHSDGWQDFARNGRMTYEFEQAENGNVALLGELAAASGVLALGLAESPEGAHGLAAAALLDGYETARGRFVAGWRGWAETLNLPAGSDHLTHSALVSAAVLKAHEDRTFPGAVVASLSIPWGNSSDSSGGYHLVWVRDAVEAGLALFAVGDSESARRMLAYLAATQQPDGHWYQNFYPDGRPFWTGVQLDEVGFPIVFAAKLHESGVVEPEGIAPMVRRAVGYLAREGPASPQDRWEENPGASPFTLAVEIAALVAAQPWLDGLDREYALALADYWNERIEDWTYVTGTPLARRHDVSGYYIRVAPAPCEGGLRGRVEVKNRSGETVPAEALVGLDFLYLVRLGLRRADDSRIESTLKVVDATLRVETPNGPAYRRYQLDGYGEHEDGSPFDGTGVGRAWPLLAGERGHGALLAGKDALPYLTAMSRMTGSGGLIPEQVWDADPIPERFLFPGRPSGSAMPLVWAHAEFLKLLVAVNGLRVEQLESVRARYGGTRPEAATWFWRAELPVERLPGGRTLVIECGEPFRLHFGWDGWQGIADEESRPIGLGRHGVRFGPGDLGRASLEFTRFLHGSGRWEGRDHSVCLR